MQLNLPHRLCHVKCHEFKRCAGEKTRQLTTRIKRTKEEVAIGKEKIRRQNAIRLRNDDNMNMIQQFLEQMRLVIRIVVAVCENSNKKS